MVPSQRGVWRGDGFWQKEEVLVLTEKNLQIYPSQTSSPLSPSRRTLCPVGKLCPLGFLSVALLST